MNCRFVGTCFSFWFGLPKPKDFILAISRYSPNPRQPMQADLPELVVNGEFWSTTSTLENSLLGNWTVHALTWNPGDEDWKLVGVTASWTWMIWMGGLLSEMWGNGRPFWNRWNGQKTIRIWSASILRWLHVKPWGAGRRQGRDSRRSLERSGFASD